MLTTILTPTYRNAAALVEAGKSVLAQTSPHWRWWIVLDEATPDTRHIATSFQSLDPRVTVFEERFDATKRHTDRYRPAMHFNAYCLRVATKYFAWLSDDDILMPSFVEQLVAHVELHPSYEVVYGECHIVDCRAGRDHTFINWLAADTPYGPTCAVMPSSRVDGGQILQTAASAREIINDTPMPDDWSYAGACDGHYLNCLAKRYAFLQYRHKVVTHRRTDASSFQR